MLYFIIYAFWITGISAEITGQGPCAGQTFGAYIPDPSSCSRFYHCTTADETLFECPPNTYFDPELKICDFTLQVNCATAQIPSAPLLTTLSATDDDGPCRPGDHDIFLPDPTDCGYFYQCVHGSNSRMPCPVGLHFSPTLNRCETPSIAGCGSGNTTTPTPKPPVEAPCTGMEAETIGIPDDCTHYIYCYLGVPAIVKCAIGEYYSENCNACIKASECPAKTTTTSTTTTAPTTSSSTTPVIPTAPTPPPTTPTPPTQSPTIPTPPTPPPTIPTVPTLPPTTTTTLPPNPVIPPCTSYDPEFIPNEEDCQRYIYCCNGIPVPGVCHDGEYFSLKDKKCIKATECPQGTPTTTDTTTTSTTTTAKPTTTSTTPIPTPPPLVPPCTSYNPETHPKASNCRQYYYCIYGTPYEVQCANGEFYSHKESGCVKTSTCPQ